MVSLSQNQQSTRANSLHNTSKQDSLSKQDINGDFLNPESDQASMGVIDKTRMLKHFHDVFDSIYYDTQELLKCVSLEPKDRVIELKIKLYGIFTKQVSRDNLFNAEEIVKNHLEGVPGSYVPDESRKAWIVNNVYHSIERLAECKTSDEIQLELINQLSKLAPHQGSASHVESYLLQGKEKKTCIHMATSSLAQLNMDLLIAVSHYDLSPSTEATFKRAVELNSKVSRLRGQFLRVAFNYATHILEEARESATNNSVNIAASTIAVSANNSGTSLNYSDFFHGRMRQRVKDIWNYDQSNEGMIHLIRPLMLKIINNNPHTEAIISLFKACGIQVKQEKPSLFDYGRAALAAKDDMGALNT